MRSLIKFPLMALLCFVGTEAVMTPQALAGRVPIVLPGSSTNGVSDGYAPSADSPAISAQVSAQISEGMLTTLRTIETQGTVSSIGDRSLSISSQQVSTITAVLSATGNEVEPAIVALEQQLSTELDGREIDISVLGSSSGDLSSAIAAANDIILSLNRAELLAAIESPTFMAMLRVLGGANEAVVGDIDLALVEGSGIRRILRMTLL